MNSIKITKLYDGDSQHIGYNVETHDEHGRHGMLIQDAAVVVLEVENWVGFSLPQDLPTENCKVVDMKGVPTPERGDTVNGDNPEE